MLLHNNTLGEAFPFLIWQNIYVRQTLSIKCVSTKSHLIKVSCRNYSHTLHKKFFTLKTIIYNTYNTIQISDKGHSQVKSVIYIRSKTFCRNKNLFFPKDIEEKSQKIRWRFKELFKNCPPNTIGLTNSALALWREFCLSTSAPTSAAVLLLYAMSFSVFQLSLTFRLPETVFRMVLWPQRYWAPESSTASPVSCRA